MTEYLKSLGIVNFLNHKELLVEFCPGFNVIAGASDSGKSAILRSISWITKNDPTGDAIKNWDANKKESVCAEMTFEDTDSKAQRSVIKERVGSTSSYTLSTLPNKLDVVGRGVPTEVQEFLNFSDLNFKGQHDPYLLQLSGGEMAKKINDLVGTSDIDISLKNLNSKALTVKRNCEELTAGIKQKTEEIEKMSYLEQLGQDISEIESLEKKRTESFALLGNINKTVTDIKTIQDEIAYNDSVLEVAEPAEEVNAMISSLEQKETRLLTIHKTIEFIRVLKESIDKETRLLKAEPLWNELANLIVELEEKQKRKNEISSLVTSIEHLSSSIETENAWLEADAPRNETTNLITQLQEKETRLARIKLRLQAIDRLREDIDKQEKEVTAKKNDLEEFLKTSGICPTCLREYEQDTICRMVNR
jgi:hypothetical protein